MATPTPPLTIAQAYPWTNGQGTYPQPVPDAPIQPILVSSSSNSITARVGTPPVAATQLEWSFKLSSSSTWVVEPATAPSVTTHSFSGLTPNASYDIRARYNGLNGFGPYSPILTQTASTSSTTDVTKIAYFSQFNGTNGATVTTVDRFGDCVYSNAVVEGTDTTSMALIAHAGSTAHGYAISIPPRATAAKLGDTYWFSIRMYRPPGYSNIAPGEGNTLKFMRMRTESPTRPNTGYDDIYLASPNSSSGNVNGGWSFIYEGVPNWYAITTTNAFQPVNGVWETYDYMVVFDTVPVTNGGQAMVRFWKNKQLLGEITNLPTLMLTDQWVHEFHHTSYWNGGAPQNQQMYVNKVGVAMKVAGVRDDTQWLGVDSAGRRLIGVGM